jgi:hypothetical protein
MRYDQVKNMLALLVIVLDQFFFTNERYIDQVYILERFYVCALIDLPGLWKGVACVINYKANACSRTKVPHCQCR